MAVTVRRVIAIVAVLVALAVGAVVGLVKMGVALPPPLDRPEIHAFVDQVVRIAGRIKGYALDRLGLNPRGHGEESGHEKHEIKIVVTSPKVMDVTITQPFVCQIRSQRHIEVRALEGGYLQKIWINEGQAVKGPRDGRLGDVMFKILPILYDAKLEAEKAEAAVARMKWQYTATLAQNNVVSPNEVALAEAEKKRAQAKADLAQAEANFTEIRTPFDGIVDRLQQREGSLIKEGDILTTLSDNSVMWVYFNVPERYYLEYMATRKQHERDDRIELVLANQDTFPQPGKIGAIEADFNNETGNIKFRADFPNPEGLLRHGQTGTIKIHRPLKDSLVIPQRATFDLLDKRYVWVVGEDHVAHQRLIATSKHELEDVYIVDKGLDAKDRLVLDGIREVGEGGKVEYEFREPEEALKNQKYHAE